MSIEGRFIRRSKSRSCLAMLVALGFGGSLSTPVLAEETAEEFFEKKIRPLLTETCYSCHSQAAEKLKGGLYLDTKSGWEKGGDSGPAIVPGKPEESLLIKAVRYGDENLQMPPKGKKLSAEQIADLEKWVAMGAPDPRVQSPIKKGQAIEEAAKKHWAFQPVQRPVPPRTKNKKWARTPVDDFILHRLEREKIKPAPDADKRTLLRRATYDLTGLPPTVEEMQSFLADASKDAFEKVVDRLLSSPRYGERWGRHWLDVARYADTKGDTPGGDPIYPYAYSYRDYVIRAFNEDVPYNHFILEQLAADQLDRGSDKRVLAALGFVTVGRRFLNNNHDTIDDRIDVMSQAFLGLTVACARCHDHKYDPIPTKDYYSLYGVFSSTYEPEPALLGIEPEPQAHRQYLAERQKKEEEIAAFHKQKADEYLKQFHNQVGDYILAIHEASLLGAMDKAEAHVRNKKLNPAGAARWKGFLDSVGATNPVFGPWMALKAIPADNFKSASAAVFAELQTGSLKGTPMNPLVVQRLTQSPIETLAEVANRYGKLFQEVAVKGRELAARPDAKTLSEPEWEMLRHVLFNPEAPGNPGGQIEAFFDLASNVRLRQLREDLERLAATHPGAPVKAMILADGTPTDPHVFVRGNPSFPGPKVPRQFLQVVAGPDRKPFARGSGRLELAQAIADPQNPLTARVLVNRVWMHHFGAPIVSTPNDFGLRSDAPLHPELLDYLATWFMDNGWSLKKLHRHLMLSRTYQMSSDVPEKIASKDVENKWFGRMNKKRLEFEALRDTLLAVGGKLDFTVGGKPVRITQQPFPGRRTVYAFVDRQELPGLFQAFDFANPDTTTGRRYDTTVPQQALFLMNSPFLAEQANLLAERCDVGTNRQSVDRLFKIVLQRAPTPEEIKAAETFLQKAATLPPVQPEPAIWQYGFGGVDAGSGRLKSFSPFTEFREGGWTTPTAPNTPALGSSFINGLGGLPGMDQDHGVIRRWIAPADGEIRISGEFSSQRDEGDGVRGRIVSSRAGILGTWVVAQRKKVEARVFRVQVKKGDTIDFVVDCQKDANHDIFHWMPKIRYQARGGSLPPLIASEFNATNDFKGPQKNAQPLSPLSQLAQVLLLSNELMFVD